MIRILLPRHTYNNSRLKLVERVTNQPLQIRSFEGVRRAYTSLELKQDSFLEVFLENESMLERICEMLTDDSILIEQSVESFFDMRTVLIDDGDDLQGVPY